MTTSSMTEGQIGRALEIFRAQLVKHTTEFSSEAVQLAFGQSELGYDLLGAFRRRVEAVSNLIIRHVRVDRSLEPQQLLDATGRVQYTDRNVVSSMPRGQEDEGDVFFFKPRDEAYDEDGLISDDALESEYEFFGFVPVDSYKLAQVHIDDPAFSDKEPSATHWRNSHGQWCYAIFDRWNDGRRVIVDRDDYRWNRDYRFAGVRK